MPIKQGRDGFGTFYRWDDPMGHKYYYIAGNTKSRESAKEKARKQVIAAAFSMEKACAKTPAPAYCSDARRFPRG